jgi:dienelactone hydrolase
MSSLRTIVALALAALIAFTPASATVPVTITDPVTIAADAHGRALLVRVTAPSVIAGRLRVILFSHGSGLSRSTYEPLASWWAQHGYVVLQPDHDDAPVDGFAPMVPPPADLWRTRIIDLKRVADSLGVIEAQIPGLRGHLDHTRLLAAGHSFGGHTVAALRGMRVWNGTAFEDFSDPRIKGAVLLSPPGSGGDDLNPAFRTRAAFLTVDLKALRGPLLLIVGSSDDSKVMTMRDADWHADIYRKSSSTATCLITMTGARHYLGGIVDPKRAGVEDADPARLELVREASLALFADALAGRAPTADVARNARGKAVEECR